MYFLYLHVNIFIYALECPEAKTEIPKCEDQICNCNTTINIVNVKRLPINNLKSYINIHIHVQ